MILKCDVSLALCLACLLRRMLPVVDRRILVEALRQVRVFVEGRANLHELELVIGVLEDPNEEPTDEFKKSLALARAHMAGRLEN